MGDRDQHSSKLFRPRGLSSPHPPPPPLRDGTAGAASPGRGGSAGPPRAPPAVVRQFRPSRGRQWGRVSGEGLDGREGVPTGEPVRQAEGRAGRGTGHRPESAELQRGAVGPQGTRCCGRENPRGQRHPAPSGRRPLSGARPPCSGGSSARSVRADPPVPHRERGSLPASDCGHAGYSCQSQDTPVFPNVKRTETLSVEPGDAAAADTTNLQHLTKS